MKLKEKPEYFIVKEVPNFSLTSKGKYSVFLLKKKQWNTEDALQKIAKKLNIHRKKIGFCGTKDRQAITEQYISIKESKERVEKIKIKDIELTFVGKAIQPLSLGDNLGNTFEIIVRDCKKPKKVKEIINYFGEQRFSKNNVEIGKAIIKKDFKKAIKLINNSDDYLKKHPNDYIGALKKIPLHIARIYVHSYQSHLWNTVAPKLKDEFVPLVGFQTKISKEYSDLLKKEGVEQKDFVIKQWPALSLEGTERKRLINIENLEIEEIKKGVFKIKFFLPKGSYATEAIKQLIP